MTYKLVLIRHGESQWNLENRFTGWTDVDLTDNGHQEAVRAGKLLKDEGYDFDVCYTSVLRRASVPSGPCWARWTGCGCRSRTAGA